jgi:hypothetical protein
MYCLIGKGASTGGPACVRSNQKLCGAGCDSTNVARVSFSLGEISPNKKKDATVRCQATLTSPSSALAHSDDADDVVPENYSFDVLDENACPSSSLNSTTYEEHTYFHCPHHGFQARGFLIPWSSRSRHCRLPIIFQCR